MPTGDLAAGRRPSARGFTYLWLLFVLALGGVGLAAVGELEQTRQQREREAELRFRGQAIAQAIGRYAEQTPVGLPPLPTRLEDLLTDRRHPRPQHHLRQLYADPFTGQPDWEPITGQAAAAPPAESDTAASAPAPVPVAGIIGVRSRSARPLMNTSGGARSARDLVFLSPTSAAAGPSE